MSLYLDKKEGCANSYHTNRNYLYNMTRLQVKHLKEVEWYELSKYIHTGLWDIPWAFSSKLDALNSTEVFIEFLNKELRRL